MPLDKHLPRLDDRRFDDILAEIRTRIPRYTPEWSPVWTDLNDSDPGITLAQLFAWMSDMLLYRLGQTPELNYIKFLQMVGIELRSAQPAQVEITFGTKKDFPASFVSVPARTQVSAEDPAGGSPIVFETERPLVALTAQLVSLQTYDSGVYTPVTEVNAAAEEGFDPFGTFPQKDGALLLGFDANKPFDRETIDLAFFSLLDGPSAEFVSCASPGGSFASAKIEWQCWNGTGWTALGLIKDETLALMCTGHVVLRAPVKGEWVSAVLGVDATPRYWMRGVLTKVQYERPPRLLAIRTNTAPARQVATIRDEVVGGSNGRRDQIFTLRQTPILEGSLRLEVDEGDGFVEWAQVDDFFASGPQDLHYALDPTSGTIRFGDGLTGAIPVANSNLPGGNVVAREYRHGGGKAGNVGPGLAKTLVRAIAGIDDAKVGNLLPALGGRDEEGLDEAKKRAPVSIKSRDRAVTVEDYEAFASQAANVARAKALPLVHPSYPNVKVPGSITIIVVPDSDDPAPKPSE
ncbi:putative baseplate assembly protein, partial [bacterium]